MRLEPADPLARQLAHFCDVICGTCRPSVSALDAARTLQVVELIALAARSGERLAVTPLALA